MITTGVVVIIAILLGVALVYAIRILKDAKAVSARVRKEAESIADDVGSLRGALASEVVKLRDFTSSLVRRVAGREKEMEVRDITHNKKTSGKEKKQ